MKKFVLLLLIFFAALSSHAQQQQETKICALTLSESPSIFGLKLQMSPAEVKTIFGKNLKLKVKRKGTFFQNFIDKQPPAFLPGVRALYLRFFDRRLYQIEVFYENENKRETAQLTEKETTEFISRLSANLNLPEITAWKTKDKIYYKLTCDGFSLAADTILNPHVELTNDAARALFEESQKTKKN